MATVNLRFNINLENAEENYSDHGSGSSSSFDAQDPCFEITKSCSKLSIQNTNDDEDSESSDDDDDAVEEPAVEIPSLDEKDEKSYLEVVRLIEGGKLDKLKVDQCKLYLKKYGLRRTGKKAVLIQRIQEHLEIKDGSGERKYPPSTFVLNCKGDACDGDIVMFEQNVYEKYNIASRSATGPSIGTRLVVGRIVKESYGAAKQQHTFTIEVLWSKGENPLPPLHPLLIKGRNLYRLKTVRQPWSNEEDRNKVIQEKHSRGSVARQVRDMRIQKKEITRSHQVKSIQKENISASNDRSSFERKPLANANNKSLIDAMDPNTLASAGHLRHLNSRDHQAYLASAGHLRHLNSRDHQAYMGMKMLEDGLKIQSSSYTGYNFLVHSNNGYGDHNGKREPCRHFLRGKCWYGERCRYVHDTSMLRDNQTHY